MGQIAAGPADGPRTAPRIGAAAALALLAVAALLVVAAAAAAAPGDVVWRDFSQRTEGGGDTYDALAVTASGDVYVAGSTTETAGTPSDVLLRKYGPSGAVRWRRVWTYPGRSDDAAAAMARDRRGSVVVAGASGSSWLLLKYSSRGYLQWVRRGRAPFARCRLTAVAVDGSGHVYATGTATPASGHARFLTLKYSAGGTFRWQATFGSPAGDAAAAGLALGGGNVYLAGQISRAPDESEAATVKYSAGGVRRWVRYYADSPADNARATAIGYAAGPVVAGWEAAASGHPGAFVLRYSPEGSSAGGFFSAVTDGGTRFDAMVVDAAGRASVAGSRWTGGVETMLTWRVEATGAWERATGAGATRGLAICRAPAGGCFSAGGTAAAVVGRFSAAGDPLWEQSVAPAGYGDFHPVAIRAGGDAYVYAAGWASRAAGGTAAMLIRIRP